MRFKRPDDSQPISPRSALLFGLGVLALLITVLVVVGFSVPAVAARLDNLAYRARSYYRQIIPHPEYLPTPALAAAAELPSPVPSSLPPVAPINLVEPRPTLTPSPTATLVLSPPTPTPTLRPPQAQVQLTGFVHEWQTWNNCGPATIAMNLSYFGRAETQVEAAAFLKPNRDDKNVSPHELAAFARAVGMEAIVRRGGSLDRLKSFLDHGLPVVVETWFSHDGDEMGHYRLLTGYDDAADEFTTVDSFNGPDTKIGYAELDANWRVFNRLYIVVYPAEQAEVVAAIIGDDMEDGVMYERLLAQAEADLAANPEDAIAYFNRGEILTLLGRYPEAVAAFDRARQFKLHWRRLWYQFTPFEAYYAVGRYQDIIDLSEAILSVTDGLEEAHYYHGLALRATGQPGATDDFRAALVCNPNFTPAAEALAGEQ